MCNIDTYAVTIQLTPFQPNSSKCNSTEIENTIPIIKIIGMNLFLDLPSFLMLLQIKKLVNPKG
jgi:hypothetical protein